MLLRSKLILLSLAPHPIQCQGEGTYAWNVKSFWVNAALQQTYFIVSTLGNPTLGKE